VECVRERSHIDCIQSLADRGKMTQSRHWSRREVMRRSIPRYRIPFRTSPDRASAADALAASRRLVRSAEPNPASRDPVGALLAADNAI
jgi:hypothetical protein